MKNRIFYLPKFQNSGTLPESTERLAVRDNTMTQTTLTNNIIPKINKNYQSPTLGEMIETTIDFIPWIGDIKGLTWDPVKATIQDGLGTGLTTAGLGIIGLIPGIGDAIKKAGKITNASRKLNKLQLSLLLNNSIKNTSLPITSPDLKKYSEELLKSKGDIKQGVKSLGIHRKYGTGRITGSQDVTNPESIGPIEYGPSRITLSVENVPVKTQQIRNFQDYYFVPRGEYVPDKIQFDESFNMSIGERPQIVGKFKDKEGIDIFQYVRQKWPINSNNNQWLSNKDKNYLWTDIDYLPIELSHKSGGKIDENN